MISSRSNKVPKVLEPSQLIKCYPGLINEIPGDRERVGTNLVDLRNEKIKKFRIPGAYMDVRPLHDAKWTSEVDQTETVNHERRADRPQADRESKHEEYSEPDKDVFIRQSPNPLRDVKRERTNPPSGYDSQRNSRTCFTFLATKYALLKVAIGK